LPASLAPLELSQDKSQEFRGILIGDRHVFTVTERPTVTAHGTFDRAGSLQLPLDNGDMLSAFITIENDDGNFFAGYVMKL
jgi:hypothetical protein